MRSTISIRATAIAVGILALTIAARTQGDPDLWGHVRFGLDMLHSRGLPSADPYSFTQDRPWINHEWLSELFMGAAWQWGGTFGLTLLKGLLVLATILIVWRAHRDVDVGWQMIAVATAAVLATQVTVTLRPQLWSAIGIALLGSWLPAPGPQRPWRFFLLFCIWANAHGGWIVGMAIVAIWVCCEIVRDRTQRLRWAIVVLVSAAGSLTTPYGIRLWVFLSETVRLARPDIAEWTPLWSTSATAWLLWILTVAWGSWFWTKLPRNRLATALVLAVLAAGAVKSIRVVPLFGIATVVLLAPALAAWRPRRALAPIRPSQERIAVGMIVIGCVAAAVWIGRSTFTCIDRNGMPNPSIVRALSQAPPGRMATFFDWGEYLLWHLGPEIKVSMDGRRETVYSERRLQDHYDVLFGTTEGLRLLERWRPEYVWLPASSTTTRDWLLSNGYRMDISTPELFVAVRDDLPRQLMESEMNAACFPH
jgi:hypothetical protein